MAVLLAVAIAFGATASVLGVYPASQSHRAQQQARLATSRSLAAQADALAPYDRALLLSLESLDIAATREAWASVQTALSRPLHPSY
ncbi:MAG: hypothetical protein WCF33_07025 [Pseudonocardiaceae bacterium]